MALRGLEYAAQTARRSLASPRAPVVPRTASSPRATLAGTPRPSAAAWTPKRPYSAGKAPASPQSASKRSSLLSIVGGAALAVGGSAAFYLTRDEPAFLAPDRWTDVKIKSVTPLTPETSLFRLEVPRSVLPPAFTSDPSARPILSLFVKEPNLQIQRAYTVRVHDAVR